MRVIWTQEAAGDLESIVNHIQKDSPEAAHRIVNEIYYVIQSLVPLSHRWHRRPDLRGRE